MRPDFSAIIDILQDYEPVNIIVESTSARNQARNYLTNLGVPLTNITWHIMLYDWAWMRDNGPVWIDGARNPDVKGDICIFDTEWMNTRGTVWTDAIHEQFIQDWGFDAWGGIEPQYENDDAVPCQVAEIEGLPCDSYTLILERGNLEFNGAGTLITSWACQNDRNPDVSRTEMEALLKEVFGLSQIVWLLSAPSSDITGGHVDGIARFIDKNTVAVARYVDQDDPDAWIFEEAASIIQDAGFQVVRNDIPGYVAYHGDQLPAIYVNWLVANGVVITTGFGVPAWDNAAKTTVEGYFPGRDVFVVETLETWYWGGGVHCVTNDQPAWIPAGTTEGSVTVTPQATDRTRNFKGFTEQLK